MTSKRTALLAALCLVGGVLLGLIGASLGLSLKTRGEAPPKVAPTPAPITQQQITNTFQDFVYRSLQWNKMYWLGVHAQQNPNNVWSYQQIFFETKPDFVIEAGTSHGGGALVWATLLAPINPRAKVLTIDIVDKLAAARKVPFFQEKVEFFLGSSTSDQVVNAIRERVKGKKAIVILDSDHAKSHVLREMELYCDFVPVGGYLLVQDTNVNGHPVFPNFGPGPWEAVEEFMAAGGRCKGGATFQVDRMRELLFFSMHPNGYLKRVK